jgi:hypothetical protein
MMNKLPFRQQAIHHFLLCGTNRTKMKITIETSLLAKRYMKIYGSHQQPMNSKVDNTRLILFQKKTPERIRGLINYMIRIGQETNIATATARNPRAYF